MDIHDLKAEAERLCTRLFIAPPRVELVDAGDGKRCARYRTDAGRVGDTNRSAGSVAFHTCDVDGQRDHASQIVHHQRLENKFPNPDLLRLLNPTYK